MRRLADRVVVLTGASGGIGQAVARSLQAQGCHLVLVDQDAEAVEELARSLGGLAVVMDVSKREAWERLADQLRAHHGRVDLLVHNAGVTAHGPFEQVALEDLEWVLDVNLRGPLMGTRVLLPLLSEDAHLVFVSSMSGLYGTPMQATYAASKYALRGLSASLRIELSSQGIGVSTVLPGTIATPFLARARSYNREESDWMAAQMDRVGISPDRVAGAVLRAIGGNRAEVTVGADAWVVSRLQRWLPGLLPRLLALGWSYR